MVLIPSTLMVAVETHPGVKEIVEESRLFVNDGDPRCSFDYDQTSLLAETSPKTALLGIATAKRTINTQANLDDFCFTGDNPGDHSETLPAGHWLYREGKDRVFPHGAQRS